MKIAYLIVTHRNPKLLGKTIDFLSSEDCAFFIHVDKKSDINDFSSIKGRNIFFIDNRTPVYWGEFSMVDAILALLERAFDSPEKYDYYVLSSGSEYPLRSREYIHNFFDKKRGDEFISILQICTSDGKLPSKGCQSYIAGKYYSYLNTLRIPSRKPVLRYAMKILARFGLARRDYRKYLGSLETYAGSTWWALTRDACQYILDFVKTDRSVCKYFEKTHASDEMFFHTILANSKFRPKIRKSLMYVDWSAETVPSRGSPVRRGFPEWLKHGLLERSSNKGGHPAWINESHMNFFERNEKVIVDDVYGSGE